MRQAYVGAMATRGATLLPSFLYALTGNNHSIKSLPFRRALFVCCTLLVRGPTPNTLARETETKRARQQEKKEGKRERERERMRERERER